MGDEPPGPPPSQPRTIRLQDGACGAVPLCGCVDWFNQTLSVV